MNDNPDEKEVKQVPPPEMKYRYKYNGKEWQDELGLNWYDLGARNLGSDIGRFPGIDPLADKYNFQSPYAFANNNPVMFMDINGMGVDEQDWIPTLDDNGDVSYVAEEGDNAQTFATQFDVSKSEAKQIVPDDIKTGETISGDKVKAITGNEVLRLDLSKEQTDEHVSYQLNFAIEHSKSKGAGGFFTNEYFNLDYTKPALKSIQGKVGNIDFKFDLPLYNTSYEKGILNPTHYPYYISNTAYKTTSSQKGTMFGKLEYIHQMRYNLYLTYGKKPNENTLKGQGYFPIYYSQEPIKQMQIKPNKLR